MDDLVRLLLIGALAATLVGCSSASQTRQGFHYADRGLHQTHYEQSSHLHSRRGVLHGRTITAKKTNTRPPKNNNYRKIAEAHVVPKIGAPSFTPLGDKSNVVTTTPSSETKIENPPSPQLDDEVKRAAIPPSSQIDDESVMKKAKATIAAHGEYHNDRSHHAYGGPFSYRVSFCRVGDALVGRHGVGTLADVLHYCRGPDHSDE